MSSTEPNVSSGENGGLASVTAALNSMSIKGQPYLQAPRVPFTNVNANYGVTHETMADGFAPPPPVTIEQAGAVLDQEQTEAYLDDMFDQQATDKLANLTETKLPTKLFRTTLMGHQEQGVRWLASQETCNKGNPFFKEVKRADGTIAYRCRITQRRQLIPPQGFGGAILADDMGLGKSFQSLALIATNPPKNHVYSPKRRGAMVDGPFVTMLVCPVSVVGNWIQQAEDHIKPGVLKVATYAGPKRETLISDLVDQKFDIVLVSYQTLVSDFTRIIKAKEKDQPVPETLFSLAYHRIILDEAHTIRNHKSKAFQAVAAVQATNKLALTGTPFVNKADDIYSLLAFVGLEPLNVHSAFKEHITDRVAAGYPSGLARLRVAMAHVSLRRTKLNTALNLPNKTKIVLQVAFPDGAHKDVHDALYSTVQKGFAGLLAHSRDESDDAKKQRGKGTKHMFLLVLRIRQACCSASLLSTSQQEQIRALSKGLEEFDSLSPSEGLQLLEMLAVATSSAVTKTDNEGNAMMSDESPKMAALMAAMRDMNLGVLPLPSTSAEVQMVTAPKIDALMNQIDTSMEADEKGVIFSSFTTFLDQIQDVLHAKGHSFTRIDGQVKTENRIKAIKAFNEEDVLSSPRFILCSLKAAGTGINLTRGSHCYMMDPWWNAAAEDQAFDRIHRMGQIRPVKIYRLVMAESMEGKLIKLQQQKAAMGKGSLEKLSAKEQKRAKMTAMKDLFEIKEVDDCEGDFYYDSDDDFIVDE